MWTNGSLSILAMARALLTLAVLTLCALVAQAMPVSYRPCRETCAAQKKKRKKEDNEFAKAGAKKAEKACGAKPTGVRTHAAVWQEAGAQGESV